MATTHQNNLREVTLSPYEAEKLLELNTSCNRRLNKKHVGNLAEAMNDGRWQTNGETIKIGRDNNGDRVLLDGQHRLQACVKSGVPLRTFVVTELSTTVFDTIDSGKRRTLADVYHTLGYAHTRLLASTIQIVDRISIGKFGIGGVAKNYPNEVAETLVQLYPGVTLSVELITKYKRLVPIQPRCAAAAHYLFSEIEPKQADEFINGIVKGINLAEDSPTRHFREKMLRLKNSQDNWTTPEVMAGLIKTWNHVRFGRTAERCVSRWTGTRKEFPKAK